MLLAGKFFHHKNDAVFIFFLLGSSDFSWVWLMGTCNIMWWADESNTSASNLFQACSPHIHHVH
jgi:hypothetical protein